MTRRTKAKDAKTSEKVISRQQNPIWQLINHPTFAEKCFSQDPEQTARLHALTRIPRAELGRYLRDALYLTSDQRAGKVVRALSDAMTNKANGDIALAIFGQCQLLSVAEATAVAAETTQPQEK